MNGDSKVGGANFIVFSMSAPGALSRETR